MSSRTTDPAAPAGWVRANAALVHVLREVARCRREGAIERDIELTLVRAVEAAGGMALKWTSPGRAGVPDRVVILRGVAFVELKAPGRRATPAQEREHARMRAAGAEVWVIDQPEQVLALVVDRLARGLAA